MGIDVDDTLLKIKKKKMKYLQNIARYGKCFSVHGFWSKISRYAKKAGLKTIYAALLYYYVLDDPNVSSKDKIINAL